MEGALELTGITIVALAAMLCGMVMTSLRQPAIVGYIFAGLILGPTGLQLVGDREQVHILAELGVLMLLYFIGMELSLRSFRRMWRLALLTTAMQLGASVGAMLLLMKLLGWPIEQAVLFGFVLALSSTAVAVRMLEDVGELRTRAGRITVGVLIAQDLAVAPMLLIIGGMAGGSFSYWIAVKVGAAIAVLTVVILFLSGKRKINLLFADLLETKPDLAPLMALGGCFGFAAAAGLVGLSPPFGAFLAGLIVGNSAQRQIVYQIAKPIESILMMVFFLSIGLLIDLPFLWHNIGMVLLLWLFIAVFKSALNMGALHLLGERWQVAFLSSVMLAQIGEFSFVLGAAAIDHGIINTDIHRMIVAVTVLSLISSPIYLGTARRIHRHALHRIDSLSRLLRLVYFREWQITRQLTARLVGATRRITKLTRRNKAAADKTANAATTAPPVHPSTGDAALAPEPANDAELTADQPDTAASEAADSAELQPGKPSRRKGRGNRRSGPRTVGGAGGGGGGDS
jgi:CPA2 family monovalent cation:H+ antiporter-2